MKIKYIKCLSVLVLTLLLGGCQKQVDNSKIDIIQSDANMIIFKDTIEYIGDGISINNQTVIITQAGSYVISGESEDGQIIVDAKGEEIELVLDDLTLTSQTSAPIYVLNAKTVTIQLNDNTINTLTDTANYQINGDEEPSATIFSKADLIFKGNGKLLINANYNDAIQSKDTLLIESGEYIINSVDDGIIGKDNLTINNGTFIIETKGDSLKSTNETDEGMGNIIINQGSYTINTTADGMQAVNQIQINDGTFTIKTTSSNSQDSTKGIKAGKLITINNGQFNINSIDDSLHSNESIQIINGTFILNSKDDAIHCDDQLIINDGTIQIESSYEGLEGNEIEINGGTIDLVSSDDGINAAGGNDQSNNMGMFGGDSFKSNGNSKITINGGNIVINAGGDGIDANGSIYINGGTIYVNGPTDQGNGTLDYDQECLITGGTLLTLGTSGMLQGTSTNSSQNSMMVVFNSNYNTGSKVTIKDSQNNIIFEYDALKSFQALIFSSSKLILNESYTIEINGSTVTSLTLSSTVTSSGNINNQMGQPNNRRM